MTRLQWIIIGAAVALFLALYIGCDRKPKNVAALEKSRALAVESTDASSLLRDAKAGLDNRQANTILALETQLEEAVEDTVRLAVLKSIARQWYEYGSPALSGYYAQLVAEEEGTEESWSIAGTTYTICLQRSQEPKIRDFCAGRAVRAFENAISINPDETTHQVNLALAYTTAPPKDDPMKGILMLRNLNQKEPDNVLILNTLARLAIQTGQYARAIERLERAIGLEPANISTICLLAQAYDGAGNDARAQIFADRCQAASEQ